MAENNFLDNLLGLGLSAGINALGLDDPDAPKAGYQGGIPAYDYFREQVPITDSLTRRPGSTGRRYFTEGVYTPQGAAPAVAPAVGIPAAVPPVPVTPPTVAPQPAPSRWGPGGTPERPTIPFPGITKGPENLEWNRRHELYLKEQGLYQDPRGPKPKPGEDRAIVPSVENREAFENYMTNFEGPPEAQRKLLDSYFSAGYGGDPIGTYRGRKLYSEGAPGMSYPSTTPKDGFRFIYTEDGGQIEVPANH